MIATNTQLVVVVVLVLVVGHAHRRRRCVSPGPATDPKMTQVERAELIDLLQKSEREFMQQIDGLTEEQWAYKPGSDRWSVSEVAEHIVLVDEMVFDRAA